MEGELLIIPKIKDGNEIYHTVLSNGKPILAAGEAEFASNGKGGYFVLEFYNHSGHYRPSTESLEIGKAAFLNSIKILNPNDL